MSLSAPQRWLFCLLAAAAAACAGPRGSADIALSWRIEPSTPALDRRTTATVVVRDAAGAPVSGARLRLEAHMTHPGMTPVVADLAERDAGVYAAQVTLPMAGAWTLVAEGTLPDGRRVTRTIEVTAAAPGGTEP